MGLKIGLVYDLRRDYLMMGLSEEDVAEFDSEETIEFLAEAIHSMGHDVDMVGHGKELCRRLVAGDRWDLVFNISEGLTGRSREAQVPALLEMYGINYTFSDPLVCAATLDKAVAKRIVQSAGLATPAFALVQTEDDIPGASLQYPLFAKPVAEGTGKGIDGRSRVDSPEQLDAVCRQLLKKFEQPVLVEEYLPGREFTVGILGNGRDARVLGTVEIKWVDAEATSGVYSFDAKENCEQLIQYVPVRAGRLRQSVENLALKSYLALECRDASRIDIRLDRRGRPSFMEVNPLPGLHPTHSDLPMIATQEGMSYGELIESIVNAALSRLGLHQCIRNVQAS